MGDAGRKGHRDADLKTPLRSLELEIGHFPLYLSNDGINVCHLAWCHVKEDELKQDCVTFRNAKGVFKSYAFPEICADPPKTRDVGIGLIGDF